MQRPPIKHPRRIKILPKYRRPNRRFHLKRIHLGPIRIPTFQEITPFLTLWSRNIGKDGRATLTVGDKVDKEGGCAVTGLIESLVSVGIEPVEMGAEVVPLAIPELSVGDGVKEGT
jgi:hypothetical protein